MTNTMKPKAPGFLQNKPNEDENYMSFPSWVTKRGPDAWSYAWSKRSALKVIWRLQGILRLICFDKVNNKLKLRMFCSWKENFLKRKIYTEEDVEVNVALALSNLRKRFLKIYRLRKGIVRLVCWDPVNNIFKLKLRMIYLWKENLWKKKMVI